MSARKPAVKAAHDACVIRVAPITRAVRNALAVSATALALAGPAFAAGHEAPRPCVLACAPASTRLAPVVDPTVVPAARASAVVAGRMHASAADVEQDNGSDITVAATGTSDAVALPAAAPTGTLTLHNSGMLTATSQAGAAFGIQATAAGVIDLSNTGNILAVSTGGGDALAIDARGDGAVNVDNSGDLQAVSYGNVADGIFASGTDVSVTNSGGITAYGYAWGAGIEAQGDLSATVNNSGSITAAGFRGYGIYATAGEGGVTVDNTGSLRVDGAYATGIHASSEGPITITQGGDITVGTGFDPDATGGAYYGTGITAMTGYDGAGITVDNAGSISVGGQYGATGVAATATGAGSTVSVTNSGTIQASATNKYYGTAQGIVASGDGDALVSNDGSVTVSSAYNAFGLSSLSFAGSADLVNTGDVHVEGGLLGQAAGLTVGAQNGTATLQNAGLVDVSNGLYSFGAQVSGLQGASLTNTGSITTSGKYAYGALVTSGQGDAVIDNAAGGVVHTEGASFGLGIAGISTTGDAIGSNAGEVFAYGYGQAIAAYERANEGDAQFTNTGSIEAVSYGQALGLTVRADLGDASATNAGSISSTAYADAIGVSVTAPEGIAALTSSGDIGATSLTGAAIGAQGSGANVALDNAGSITALAYATNAYGAIGVGGDVSIGNDGQIAVTAAQYGFGAVAQGVNAQVHGQGQTTVTATQATGLAAFGSVTAALDHQGDVDARGAQVAIGASVQAPQVTIANGGSLSATQTDTTFQGDAIALLAAGDDVTVDNSGSLSATGDMAVGLRLNATTSGTVVNAGTISATSTGTENGAIGLYATGAGALGISNAGDISATSYNWGYGMVVRSTGGAVSVSNSGAVDVHGTVGIYASGTDVQMSNSGDVNVESDPDTVGIGLVAAASGESSVTNSGDITADVAVLFNGAGSLDNSGTIVSAVAVMGDDAAQDVHNSGQMLGALRLGGGDDSLTNASGGLWSVHNTLTDFGDGDDSIVNATGATIDLDGAIDLGSSAAGNSFLNQGTLRVNGTGLIDMGTNAAGDAPNALAFTNAGLIAMADGATDDTLTIAGDLGGTGHVSIDVDADNGAADQLVVQGDMATGAVQTVDVRFSGLPGVSMTPVAFATVSGDSTAGSFRGGAVTGFDASNFLNLRVDVTSQQNTADGDVFSVGVAAAGLSASGRAAASAAPGILQMIDTGVGTWRERMGLNPELADGRVGLGPWVRAYSRRGDLEARQDGGNFDQGGPLALRQSTNGTEVGFDAHVGGGVHAGVFVGRMHGTTRTADSADRLRGGVSGVYASWFAPQGFYVDLSHRWMDFTVDTLSAGGPMQARGGAHAWNVEAGYDWALGSFHLVPQAQYTHARVDNLTAFDAQATTFEADGATSRRGRIGLEANTTLGSGAVRWTPYAAISAVREFDGRAGYSISDTFAATTTTEGTFGKVDLGVGMQVKGFSVTAGASWADGGAVKSETGGQVVMRYTW